MLTIRLSRIGKRKQPTYRIIILEKKKDPFGDYLELLGNYNPRTKEINLKVERIKYWLSVGAETSNTVYNLLVKEGIIEAKDKKRSVKITKKRKARKEGKVAEASLSAKAPSKAEVAKVEASKKGKEAPTEEPSTNRVEETLVSDKQVSKEEPKTEVQPLEEKPEEKPKEKKE